MADLTKIADALKNMGEAERALQELKQASDVLSNDTRKIAESVAKLSTFLQQLKG